MMVFCTLSAGFSKERNVVDEDAESQRAKVVATMKHQKMDMTVIFWRYRRRRGGIVYS